MLAYFRCMLDDCQETFETTGERNAHRRTFHMLRQSHYFYFPQSGQRDLSKKYQCGKCVRGFKSKSTYDQHILRHEAQEAGSSGAYEPTIENCPKYIKSSVSRLIQAFLRARFALTTKP